jgi:hypothetical protein
MSQPPERVRQVTLPPAARALSTFGRIDYHDAFLVQASPEHDRTAWRWAQVMLEEAPEAMQHKLRRGWSTLGLELGPARSDHCVLGWEIRRTTPDVALLGVSGRRGLSGELLFERQPGRLLFATFVHLDNRVARTLWAAIAPRHRRVVRNLLEQASVRALPPAGAVGEFAQDVDMAVVPGGLLGQVQQDPAQRDWLGAPAQVARGRGVQVEESDKVSVPSAGSPVVSQQLSERYAGCDPELAIRIVLGPRRVDRAAERDGLDPIAFDPAQVADQPGDRHQGGAGQGGLAGIGIGQAGALGVHGVAGVVQERRHGGAFVPAGRYIVGPAGLHRL